MTDATNPGERPQRDDDAETQALEFGSEEFFDDAPNFGAEDEPADENGNGGAFPPGPLP